MNNRAVLAHAAKNYHQSAQFLERALAIYRLRLPPNHAEIGKTLLNLGSTYADLGNRDGAIRVFRDGLEILQNTWGPDDVRLVRWLTRYAQVLREREDFAEAGKQEMNAMRIRVSNTLRQGPR